MPPPKKADPPHKMVLTTNSLRNTTIAVDNDALYYEIVTRFWHPHLTKIKKLDPDTAEMVTIAELEREPGKEPRVRFGGEDAEWVPAWKFLEKEPQKVLVFDVSLSHRLSFFLCVCGFRKLKHELPAVGDSSAATPERNIAGKPTGDDYR